MPKSKPMSKPMSNSEPERSEEELRVLYIEHPLLLNIELARFRAKKQKEEDELAAKAEGMSLLKWRAHQNKKLMDQFKSEKYN